jgi:hypothetical protein
MIGVMKGEILDMKDIDVECDMRTSREERCGEGKPPRVLLGSGGNGQERDEKAAPTAEIDMRRWRSVMMLWLSLSLQQQHCVTQLQKR